MNIIYVGFPGLGFQVKNLCVMFVSFLFFSLYLFWRRLFFSEYQCCSRYCTRLEVDLYGKIKDILHITYERKTKGHGSGAEGGSPFQIQIRVKPTTPCATKTSKEEKSVNQHVISGRRIFTRRGSSGNSSRSVSSETSSQVSKGGSTTNFTMKIQDPTIRLPEF
jgi:hypothetical protein